jgi:3-oxoacyl-[acyl-carrier protein] reductase
MTDALSEDARKKLFDMIPLNKLGEADDIAKLALFLSSDDSSYITGQVISVNGGMYM